MSDGIPILKLDARGRVTIATVVRRQGSEPSALYRALVAANGTITLEPVSVVAAASVTNV